MSVIVTEHAIDRYIERVEHVERDMAREKILSAQRGIDAAARFGATTVKTPHTKLVLQGTTVVTVFPRNWVMNPHLSNAEARQLKQAHRQAWAGRSAAA